MAMEVMNRDHIFCHIHHETFFKILKSNYILTTLVLFPTGFESSHECWTNHLLNHK